MGISKLVRIISLKRIRDFAQGDLRSAGEPLRRWASTVRESFWANPGELKTTFHTADFVGDLTVFNIGGNKYRLIAFVDYRRQIIYIKHILTHKQYDKGDWKNDNPHRRH